MDCIVHGVAKSQTRLSDFHFGLSTLLDETEGKWPLTCGFLKIILRREMVRVKESPTAPDISRRN